MRISTKGRHAVMAMVDLARHSNGKPVSLADIAGRQGISLSYLEQLIARLKAQNLVKSLRGPGGGYLLEQPPEKISVGAIINAVDDPIPRLNIEDHATATGRQLTDLLWQAINDEISQYLHHVTLADVSTCNLTKFAVQLHDENEVELDAPRWASSA